MSNKVLVEAALERQRVFKSLGKYLDVVKKTVSRLDPCAEVYLFGSVAENNYTFSSDIDVLVVTSVEPARVHMELWKSGVKEPFEIHVQPPDKVDFYRRRAKLLRI